LILSWPFTGRGKEVEAILSDLRRGVGTVIAGEAGVGKTMLAREVQRQMDLDGWRTHLVRCTARSGNASVGYENGDEPEKEIPDA
jgi:MoxR-like ATPase